MSRPALVLCALVVGLVPRASLGAADRQTAETLTQLAAVAASEVAGTEVLSSRDIEEIVRLEADKQLMGCSDETDCLAEVAGALGARFVVFSQLGQLDDELVLTLNVFDGEEAKSVGRRVVRGASVSTVADGVGPAVKELLASVMTAPAEGEEAKPVRVLVMDVRIAGGAPVEGAAAASEAPAEPNLLGPILWGTGGVLLAGAGVALVAGVILGAAAEGAYATVKEPTTAQTDIGGLVEARDTNALLANASYGTAAVVALVGGAVLGAGFVVGGGE